jgi:hypothetical protein
MRIHRQNRPPRLWTRLRDMMRITGYQTPYLSEHMRTPPPRVLKRLE